MGLVLRGYKATVIFLVLTLHRGLLLIRLLGMYLLPFFFFGGGASKALLPTHKRLSF